MFYYEGMCVETLRGRYCERESERVKCYVVSYEYLMSIFLVVCIYVHMCLVSFGCYYSLR